jgi:hypothetical protein
MIHINLPYQQAEGNNAEQTNKLHSLENQLVQLWAIHGGENNSTWLMVMKNRTTEVLGEVARWGWQEYRSICEDATETARRLWRKCEALVMAAVELDGMEENGLLYGCKRLLEACDLLIDSEEEILCLMDMGTEDYRSAYQNGDLCWQRHCCQS